MKSDNELVKSKNKIIFTSYSKRNFYFRAEVSQFVLKLGCTPINPFMNFDYNLSGVIDKKYIRISNNSLVACADELWVFGEISDGVLAEIYLATKRGIKVRLFRRLSTGVFVEIHQDESTLEDVSEWLWEYVKAGKDISRWHPRLRFYKKYPLVFAACSKRNFYLQQHISQFCLERHRVPLSPFLLFRYFIGDSVPRKNVYEGNNILVAISEELWVFDEVSDGVLAEIINKRSQGGEVKYFRHYSDKLPIKYRRVPLGEVEFETPRLGDENIEKYRDRL